jgi:hypothetical protein
MAQNRKRDLIWKHNSFFGHVRMDMTHMNAIIYSETATPAAKQTANEIWQQLRKLQLQLKERVDANP